MKRHLVASALCLPLAGCAVSPSLNVLGAYFPDWMFCIAGASFATILARLGVRAFGPVEGTRSVLFPVAYFELALVLALSAWLIFFRN